MPRSTAISLLAAALVVLGISLSSSLVSAAGAATPSDIGGTWNLVPGSVAAQSWTFSSGSGTLAGEGGGGPYTWPMEGTNSGGSVQIKTAYRGSSYTAYFVGTVSSDGETMSGTWSTGGYAAAAASSSTWVARRASSTTSDPSPTPLPSTDPSPQPAPQRSPTALRVTCTYFFATDLDVCTATVGDATGAGLTPTGMVVFTGERTGQCQLQATALSPGVASCSIVVPGTTSFLKVTGTYQGDATHAESAGSTQFFFAPPGTGLYNQTIQRFKPNVVNVTNTNTDQGATVKGQVTLTDGVGTDCSNPPTGEASTAVAAVRRAAIVKTLRSTSTLRNVPRGKFQMRVKLDPVRARKLFRTNQTLTLIVKVTVQPRRGKARSVTTLQRVRVRFTKRSVLLVGVTAARAAQADTTKCYPSATINFSGTRGVQGSGGRGAGWYGTLNLTVVIPAGVPGPERDVATVARLVGSITLFCNRMGKTQAVNIDETITGPPTANGSPSGISYRMTTEPGGRVVSLSGQLPAPGDPADQCPSINLSNKLLQVGDVLLGPAT
jgi:hypothetical protein